MSEGRDLTAVELRWPRLRHRLQIYTSQKFRCFRIATLAFDIFERWFSNVADL